MQISALLHRLCDHMRQHFVEEEAGGCLEEAVAQAPHLAHHLRELEEQHALLLAEIEQIIQATDGQAPEVVQRQFAAIHSFAARLLGHEALENRLLQVGFNEDLDLDDTPV